MKIDLTQILTTPSGEPLKDAKKDMSLQAALVMGLLNAEAKTGDEKYGNWRMAMKIQDNSELDFNAEDVVRLKRVCGFLPTMFVGRIYEILDPKTD